MELLSIKSFDIPRADTHHVMPQDFITRNFEKEQTIVTFADNINKLPLQTHSTAIMKQMKAMGCSLSRKISRKLSSRKPRNSIPLTDTATQADITEDDENHDDEEDDTVGEIPIIYQGHRGERFSMMPGLASPTNGTFVHDPAPPTTRKPSEGLYEEHHQCMCAANRHGSTKSSLRHKPAPS